jgi:hypothetical protein
MAAGAPTFGIRRDEDERLALMLERLGGHGGRGRREPPDAAILPRVDEAADRLVVGDRRTSACEREAPAGALATAADGPGGRRAAALAAGAAEPRQGAEAGCAHLGTGKPARDAALRQQEVEQDRSHAPDGTAEKNDTGPSWNDRDVTVTKRHSPGTFRLRAGGSVSAVGGGKLPHPD